MGVGNVSTSKNIFEKGMLKSGVVIHIHGSVRKPETMLLTMKEYIELYSSNEYKNFLKKIFEEYTVLFIGYGLEELEILDFVVKSANVKAEAKKEKRFLLLALFENEIEKKQFYECYYETLGVSIVPYSISSKGYDQLCEIIKEWSKDLTYLRNLRNKK